MFSPPPPIRSLCSFGVLKVVACDSCLKLFLLFGICCGDVVAHAFGEVDHLGRRWGMYEMWLASRSYANILLSMSRDKSD